jgi:ligand-binding SRPBCC domain-containing protein
MLQFSITSFVKTPREAVWSRISQISGVNEEFYPILKMTCPEPNMRISPSHITGKPLFRSWLLLLGIMPIEYDLIQIVACEDGVGFTEKSSMALMSEWHHQRILVSTARGTRITDNLKFRPRRGVFFLGWLFKRIVAALFRYRHHRLGEMFGSSMSAEEADEMIANNTDS